MPLTSSGNRHYAEKTMTTTTVIYLKFSYLLMVVKAKVIPSFLDQVKGKQRSDQLQNSKKGELILESSSSAF